MSEPPHEPDGSGDVAPQGSGEPSSPHPTSIGGGNVFEEAPLAPSGPEEFELELPAADEDYGVPWLPALFVFGAGLSLLLPACRIKKLADVVAVLIAAVAALLAAWAASLFRRLPKKRHSLRTLIVGQLFLMATLGVIYFEVKRQGFGIPQSMAQAALGGLLVWSLTADLRTFVPRKTMAPPSWREIKKRIAAPRGGLPQAPPAPGDSSDEQPGGSIPAGSDGPPDDAEEGS